MKMKRMLIFIALLAFFALYLEDNAFARAGKSGGSSGRSSIGSRGSRTYSQPSRPAPSQNQYQNQQTQQRPLSPSPMQPAPSGGFFRSLAGGLAGGFLGAMLFRSLGFGGGFGGSGGFGGIGIIEILLLAGIGFVIYKMVKARRREAPAYAGEFRGQQQDPGYNYQPLRDISPAAAYGNDLGTGLSHIRQFDPAFDENRFKEQATDIFFKVQAAWMNRNMDSALSLFAPEIFEEMRAEISKMKAEGRINRLENIAMRNVELTEAWQEQGRDYITVSITANVLDYVTDEAGRVIEGSKAESVRFMEYWTFARPAGTGAWQLSAIQQAE